MINALDEIMLQVGCFGGAFVHLREATLVWGFADALVESYLQGSCFKGARVHLNEVGGVWGFMDGLVESNLEVWGFGCALL